MICWRVVSDFEVVVDCANAECLQQQIAFNMILHSQAFSLANRLNNTALPLAGAGSRGVNEAI